jgi:uncharacterized membrane protein
MIERSWLGPLPAPDALHAFGEVNASFPERIVAMTEREQTHRHRQEQEELQATIEDQIRSRRERRLGQTLGFILALVLTGSGIALTLASYPTVGGIDFSTTVAGVVTTFVVGRGRAAMPPEKPASQTHQNRDS